MPQATIIPSLREDQVRLLDAAEEALLAPVRGEDRRRRLPKEYFRKKPARFAGKFLFALGLTAAGWVVIGLSPHWTVIALAVLVLGLMYAHLVELQHECLHEHAFRSRRLNRLCGFICGIFLLSSFWHYKYDHLRHHAFLGTPENREFFNYRFRRLDSRAGFAVATLHPGRYVDVFRTMIRCCFGRPIPDVTRERDRKKITAEYRLLAALLVAAVAGTAVTGSLLVPLAWFLPSLVVGEAAHFLIEMPEHFGLNTQTDPNVLANTRSINASRLAQWYTNYNNLHTAHHYHQGVPMAQASGLHALIAGRIEAVENSYWSFYRKVIRGDIRYQNAAETCMTR
jgi:fatty acid desaturase